MKIAGSRETCNPHIEVLSAPTSPSVDQPQTPLKLSTNLGRNPLRGSKCNFLIFLLFFLVGAVFEWEVLGDYPRFWLSFIGLMKIC